MDRHCTKRTYISKAAAKREVRKMKTFGRHGLHAYRCDRDCGPGIFHIGHANERDRERIRNGDMDLDESDSNSGEGLTTGLELPKELS